LKRGGGSRFFCPQVGEKPRHSTFEGEGRAWSLKRPICWRALIGSCRCRIRRGRGPWRCLQVFGGQNCLLAHLHAEGRFFVCFPARMAPLHEFRGKNPAGRRFLGPPPVSREKSEKALNPRTRGHSILFLQGGVRRPGGEPGPSCSDQAQTGGFAAISSGGGAGHGRACGLPKKKRPDSPVPY